MKRVNMIKILEDSFKTYDNYQNIAQTTLSVVESAGMRPPENITYGCSGCSGCSQCNGDGYGEDMGWDN